MKKAYKKPEVNVTLLESENIMTLSGVGSTTTQTSTDIKTLTLR